MATATVEITLPGLTGFTLDLKLYPYQSDTLSYTLSSLTEATNRKGTYSGTQEDPTAGLYHAIALEGSSVRGEGYVYVTNAEIVHTVMDSPAAARIGTPAGVSVSADIASVKTDLTTLLGRITANLFSGITYMKNWLAVIMGSTADAGTLAEVNATTAGVTYSNTTDSLEANSDAIDALPTADEIDTELSGTHGAGSWEAVEVLSSGDIDGFTLEETLKLCLAALVGKLSGASGTTITIRSADDSANRIVATVDSYGNRSAVTLNGVG